jgi:hypothetical protein
MLFIALHLLFVAFIPMRICSLSHGDENSNNVTMVKIKSLRSGIGRTQEEEKDIITKALEYVALKYRLVPEKNIDYHYNPNEWKERLPTSSIYRRCYSHLAW